MTFESPVTAVGLVRVVCVPSPSCPDAFPPHAQMVPSVFNAYVLLPPAAMATTPVIDEIHVGVDRVVVVPSPSWPNPFAPHVHTVPVSANTTECAAAALDRMRTLMEVRSAVLGFSCDALARKREPCGGAARTLDADQIGVNGRARRSFASGQRNSPRRDRASHIARHVSVDLLVRR